MALFGRRDKRTVVVDPPVGEVAAESWFRRAADGGFVLAQNNLGVLLMERWGDYGISIRASDD